MRVSIVVAHTLGWACCLSLHKAYVPVQGTRRAGIGPPRGAGQQSAARRDREIWCGGCQMKAGLVDQHAVCCRATYFPHQHHFCASLKHAIVTSSFITLVLGGGTRWIGCLPRGAMWLLKGLVCSEVPTPWPSWILSHIQQVEPAPQQQLHVLLRCDTSCASCRL